MVTRHSKKGNSFTHKDKRTYYNCNKLGHIAHYCYKDKNKETQIAKNAKEKVDFSFTI